MEKNQSGKNQVGLPLRADAGQGKAGEASRWIAGIERIQKALEIKDFRNPLQSFCRSEGARIQVVA